MLQPGLYEQVINEQLDKELSLIPQVRKAVMLLKEQRPRKYYHSTLQISFRKDWIISSITVETSPDKLLSLTKSSKPFSK